MIPPPGDDTNIRILGGTNAGKVDWAKTVLDRAKKTGLSLDKEGNLVEEKV